MTNYFPSEFIKNYNYKTDHDTLEEFIKNNSYLFAINYEPFINNDFYYSFKKIIDNYESYKKTHILDIFLLAFLNDDITYLENNKNLLTDFSFYANQNVILTTFCFETKCYEKLKYINMDSNPIKPSIDLLTMQQLTNMNIDDNVLFNVRFDVETVFNYLKTNYINYIQIISRQIVDLNYDVNQLSLNHFIDLIFNNVILYFNNLFTLDDDKLDYLLDKTIKCNLINTPIIKIDFAKINKILGLTVIDELSDKIDVKQTILMRPKNIDNIDCDFEIDNYLEILSNDDIYCILIHSCKNNYANIISKCVTLLDLNFNHLVCNYKKFYISPDNIVTFMDNHCRYFLFNENIVDQIVENYGDESVIKYLLSRGYKLTDTVNKSILDEIILKSETQMWDSVKNFHSINMYELINNFDDHYLTHLGLKINDSSIKSINEFVDELFTEGKNKIKESINLLYDDKTNKLNPQLLQHVVEKLINLMNLNDTLEPEAINKICNKLLIEPTFGKELFELSEEMQLVDLYNSDHCINFINNYFKFNKKYAYIYSDILSDSMIMSALIY